MSSPPLDTAKLREDTFIVARFWSKVRVPIRPGPCWLWLAAVDRGGYGRFVHMRRTYGAHRVALALSGTEIPRDAHVIHSCDVPACVNPTHLRVGTHQDNTDDRMLRRGRASFGSLGESNGAAILTERSVIAIREASANGTPHHSLALEYGVSPSTIRSAVSGRTWAHVDAALLGGAS